MLGRPHGSLERTGHLQGSINIREAAMSAKLVCDSETFSCYKHHAVGQNIHNQQWKEQQEFGDMTFLPDRVRLQVSLC